MTMEPAKEEVVARVSEIEAITKTQQVIMIRNVWQSV